MPIPKPTATETRAEFLQRCIPVEVKAGKSRAQAAAICNTEYSKKI